MITLLLIVNFITVVSYQKITGADLIIKKLNQHNINTVFGYPGGANLKLMDALYQSNIRTIVNRHEQFSGFSAEGYSRASNSIGCVITTSGPGLTNIITPLQDAYSDGIALLAISGQVDSSKLGSSAFQECDATALTKPCTKYNKIIKNIFELEQSLDLAIEFAMKDRKGPVHLDICANVFNEELYYDEIKKYEGKPKVQYLNYIQTTAFYDIFNVIKRAKNPVLIVGQGGNRYYLNIRKFIKHFNLPTTTTLHGLGIIDENDELALEMLGMHGSYTANNAIQQADLIIGLGYRFDDRTIGNINLYGINAKNNFGIVHIDISPEKIDEVKKVINPTYSLLMDCNDFINKMMEISDITNLKINNREWITHLNILKNKYPFKNEKSMSIPYIINKLNNKLEKKDNYIICAGVGVHQMNIAQHFKWKYPNTFLTSGSQGSMGSCLGFAIGAQLAHPDKLIICIDGDGSFMMSCNDLITIVENKLPIKIFIMDNENLGMVSNWQDDFYNGNRAFSTLQNPNFVQLANSMGIASVKCDDINNIDSCLNEINNDYPLLIHFKVKQEKCLPFVAPGKALDDMII